MDGNQLPLHIRASRESRMFFQANCGLFLIAKSNHVGSLLHRCQTWASSTRKSLWEHRNV
jgi:hypothetical protein